MIVHPEVKNWLKYARFEEKNQFISSARQIYERAVEYFGDDNIDEGLLIAFAKFEEGQREVRVIIRHSVNLNINFCTLLYNNRCCFYLCIFFTQFSTSACSCFIILFCLVTWFFYVSSWHQCCLCVECWLLSIKSHSRLKKDLKCETVKFFCHILDTRWLLWSFRSIFSINFCSANPNFRLSLEISHQITLRSWCLISDKDWCKYWSHPMYTCMAFFSLYA